MDNQNLRILIKQVTVELLLGVPPMATTCRFSLTLETDIAGPFLGDTDDLEITIDYSRIVRHILQVLPGSGPFADAATLADAVLAYVVGFDERITAQHLRMVAGNVELEREWRRGS
jgi:dihydroneopterin aldolase